VHGKYKEPCPVCGRPFRHPLRGNRERLLRDCQTAQGPRRSLVVAPAEGRWPRSLESGKRGSDDREFLVAHPFVESALGAVSSPTITSRVGREGVPQKRSCHIELGGSYE